MSTSDTIESISSNGFDVPEGSKLVTHDAFALKVNKQMRETTAPRELLSWSRSKDVDGEWRAEVCEVRILLLVAVERCPHRTPVKP